MKENINFKKEEQQKNNSFIPKMNYSYRQLAFIVFGGIILYFFILKFNSVQGFLAKLVSILFPFILGAAIAFVLKFPVNFFEKKFFAKSKNKFLVKASRGLSLLLSIIIFFAVIAFMISMVLPQLVNSVQTLEKQIPLFFEYVINWMKSIPLIEPYALQLENLYNSLSFDYIFSQIKGFLLTKDTSNLNSDIIQTASGIANSILSGITNGLLGFVFSIYIILDKERVTRQTKRILYSVGGLKVGGFIIHVGELMNHYFFNFIKGQLLDALIIGIMTFVSMLLLRMPYSAMIAILVAFSDLIPIVGPIIGAAIGFIFILIESPIKALIFLVLMIILQQIQSNIIYPKIVGDNLGIPAMWSLFATIVGGSLGGIVGMWVFIPLTAVIYTLLGEYTSYKLNKLNITELEEV